MSLSPERNGSARRARQRRLRGGFLAETADQVDDLAALLGQGEVDGETRDSMAEALDRQAQTAATLELGDLGSALREAGISVLSRSGHECLEPVARALSAAGYRATFPPMAVVASVDVQIRLRPEAELCCEPVLFYDHTRDACRQIHASGLQGVVLPASQLAEADGFTDVPLYAYSAPDHPGFPMDAAEAGARGFLLEPLQFREVLSLVRRGAFDRMGPLSRVVLVLGVDELREQLVADLEGRGVLVGATSTRDQVLQLLGETVPDLVVVGADATGASAAALAHLVRGLDRHGETRVVAVGPVREEPAALQAGAEALLDATAPVASLGERIHQRLTWSPRRFRVRDPVSGVLTRPALLEAVDRELARARRTAMPLATAILDVDETKSLNTRWGRAAGNRALHTVGEALTRCLRANDVVGRLGSDTFLVAMPACSVEHARRRLLDIQRLLAELAGRDPRLEDLGFTAGVAGTERGLGSVLTRADRVLARAKNQGRPGAVEVE